MVDGMTREDIIRMAQNCWPSDRRMWSVDADLPRLERFAALVAAEKDKQIAFLKDSHDAMRELAYKTGVEAEREACAKDCETLLPSQRIYDRRFYDAVGECVLTIRARGDK